MRRFSEAKKSDVRSRTGFLVVLLFLSVTLFGVAHANNLPSFSYSAQAGIIGLGISTGLNSTNINAIISFLLDDDDTLAAARAGLISISAYAGGQATVSGANGSVLADSTVILTNIRTSNGFNTAASADGAFSIQVDGVQGDAYRVVVQDGEGNQSAAIEITDTIEISTDLDLYGCASAVSGFYISPTGNDANPGTAARPFATFNHAFSRMVSGDVLWVMDGVYHQQIKGMPSGTAAAYTRICAVNRNKADIDGMGNVPANSYESLLYVSGKSYVVVEGLKVHHSSMTNDVCEVSNSDHISFGNMSCYQGGGEKHDLPYKIAASNFVLVQDSWGFGSGRYIALVFESNDITIRRFVGRWDANPTPNEPIAGVSIYSTSRAIVENNIILDFNKQRVLREFSAFYVPANHFAANDNQWAGNIAFNLPKDDGATTYGARGFQTDAGNVGSNNGKLVDFVAYNVARGVIMTGKASNYNLSNISIINTVSGFSHGSNITNTTISNIVVTGSSGVGYSGFGSKTITHAGAFNNAGGDYSNGASCSSNCLFSDPDFSTIVEITSGPYNNAGVDGKDIGATIRKRYVNGVLTGDNLWPYPNEVLIKTNMCDASFLTSIGRTGAATPGLCASGKTLTNYILDIDP